MTKSRVASLEQT